MLKILKGFWVRQDWIYRNEVHTLVRMKSNLFFVPKNRVRWSGYRQVVAMTTYCEFRELGVCQLSTNSGMNFITKACMGCLLLINSNKSMVVRSTGYAHMHIYTWWVVQCWSQLVLHSIVHWLLRSMEVAFILGDRSPDGSLSIYYMLIFFLLCLLNILFFWRKSILATVIHYK